MLPRSRMSHTAISDQAIDIDTASGWPFLPRQLLCDLGKRRNAAGRVVTRTQSIPPSRARSRRCGPLVSHSLLIVNGSAYHYWQQEAIISPEQSRITRHRTSGCDERARAAASAWRIAPSDKNPLKYEHDDFGHYGWHCASRRKANALSPVISVGQ